MPYSLRRYRLPAAVQPAGETLVNELNEVGKTMVAEWLEAAGDEGKAIIDAYRAMQ